MLDKTLELLKTYLSNNSVAPDALPGLIRDVYGALKALEGQQPVPSIRIEDTVTDDYIICLEDGRKLKILKRHLQQTYGMTPEAYREKWGLPADYPMVAKNYGLQRSKIAKAQGLGKNVSPQ